MKTTTQLVLIGAGLLGAIAGCTRSESTAAWSRRGTPPVAGACCGANDCRRACCPRGQFPTASAGPVDEKTADALRAAITDERRVQEYYRNVIGRYGPVRPFSNIVNAEERHEAIVADLMRRHSVSDTGYQPNDVPAVPPSLAESRQVAAQLERENAALYERLLEKVTEPDIRAAFTNLRMASLDHHLPAFER